MFTGSFSIGNDNNNPADGNHTIRHSDADSNYAAAGNHTIDRSYTDYNYTTAGNGSTAHTNGNPNPARA
ncbi:MAG: hypothetical protein A2Y90_03315 [Chloroflexi bacterium RBG_13_52_12]|nr:MAG: hypothetical protein A2Y90_03315 [Chloroflexi bacterium RBG_13_52_12]